MTVNGTGPGKCYRRVIPVAVQNLIRQALGPGGGGGQESGICFFFSAATGRAGSPGHGT